MRLVKITQGSPIPRSQRRWTPAMPLLALLAVGAASPQWLRADDGPRRFYLVVEGYLPGLELDTELRVDSPRRGLGTVIDLEDDLGLDDEVNDLRLRLGFRLTKRQEIELAYRRVRRAESRSLGRSLVIGDSEFAAGLQATAELTTEDLELSYKYFLLRKESHDFGLSLGIHGFLADIEARGRAGIVIGPIGDPREFDIDERASSELPLLVAGIHGSRRLGSKWVFNGHLKAFGLVEVERYSGEYWEAQAAVEHETFRHLGFGAGFYWTRLSIDAEVGPSVLLGSIETERQGIHIFTRVRF